MISHQDQMEIYFKRYNLNAAEAAENAKSDRQLLQFLKNNQALKTKFHYTQWLQQMEILGSPD